jgi:hypothetical protein
VHRCTLSTRTPSGTLRRVGLSCCQRAVGCSIRRRLSAACGQGSPSSGHMLLTLARSSKLATRVRFPSPPQRHPRRRSALPERPQRHHAGGSSGCNLQHAPVVVGLIGSHQSGPHRVTALDERRAAGFGIEGAALATPGRLCQPRQPVAAPAVPGPSPSPQPPWRQSTSRLALAARHGTVQGRPVGGSTVHPPAGPGVGGLLYTFVTLSFNYL